LEGAREKIVRICQQRFELECLQSTEQLADLWLRAQRLREYAAALEACPQDILASEPADRGSRVEWIRNAADWMDPLVNKVWPAVDDVPESPV
jgi:hypothetical protein